MKASCRWSGGSGSLMQLASGPLPEQVPGGQAPPAFCAWACWPFHQARGSSAFPSSFFRLSCRWDTDGAPSEATPRATTVVPYVGHPDRLLGPHLQSVASTPSSSLASATDVHLLP